MPGSNAVFILDPGTAFSIFSKQHVFQRLHRWACCPWLLYLTCHWICTLHQCKLGWSDPVKLSSIFNLIKESNYMIAAMWKTSSTDTRRSDHAITLISKGPYSTLSTDNFSWRQYIDPQQEFIFNCNSQFRQFQIADLGKKTTFATTISFKCLIWDYAMETFSKVNQYPTSYVIFTSISC